MPRITVYSMDGCSACQSAISLLQSKQESFVVKKVDEDQEAWDFIKKEGHRSMPQIYSHGVLIPGGYKGLVEYLKN